MTEPTGQGQLDLQDFGEMMTSKGVQFVRLAGARVRLDACRPFRGTGSYSSAYTKGPERTTLRIERKESPRKPLPEAFREKLEAVY